MLTANQLCVLYPQYAKNPCNGLPDKRPPKKCLFGPPDPLETRRLFEEQCLADRQLMLRKYGFDILTFRSVPDQRSVTDREAVTGYRDMPRNFLIPAGFPIMQATNDGAGQRFSSSESEVRHRPGRHSPYNRQTRITGESPYLQLCKTSRCKCDVAEHIFVVCTGTACTDSSLV